MAGIVDLFGKDNVIGKKGVVDIEEICKDKAAIGIYFSAHWCPPCRGFTPRLVEFYDANKEKFECIFVSSDRDETSFNEYYADMPWHALAFSCRDKKQEISEKYNIRGIPTLVILKPNGETITTNGRGDVMSNIATDCWLKDDSAAQQKST